MLVLQDTVRAQGGMLFSGTRSALLRGRSVSPPFGGSEAPQIAFLPVLVPTHYKSHNHCILFERKISLNIACRNSPDTCLAGYLGAAKAARGSAFPVGNDATPRDMCRGYFWRFFISSTNFSSGTASCNPFARSRTMMLFSYISFWPRISASDMPSLSATFN